MLWSQSQTDKDWAAQHMVNEQLRHERLAREASLVDWIETTPANEPLPKMSMARFRQEILDKQAEALKKALEEPDDLKY